MPAISARHPCLFCRDLSCADCRRLLASEQAKLNKSKRKHAQPKLRIWPAADACQVCARLPNDRDQQRCPFCPADAPGPRRCVNCQARPSRTAFGLCRKCYKAMPIKEKHKLTPRKRHLTPTSWETTDPAPPPTEPTNFSPAPGSREARVAIMERRADNRQELFHDGDVGNKSFPSWVQFKLAMALRFNAPRGIYRQGNRWRARPWFGYRRFHCGCFRNHEDAIKAVKKWKLDAAEIGPQRAAEIALAGARKLAESQEGICSGGKYRNSRRAAEVKPDR